MLAGDQNVSTPPGRFKTPTGSGMVRRSIPSYGSTPGGTKKAIARNPFDRPGEIFERLQSNTPMFSPNFFTVKDDDDESSPKEFEWSLDQKATLMPAAIDERPIQQDSLNLCIDPVLENKTQHAIDTYFSTRKIVPSPLDQPAPKYSLPRTPGHDDADSEQPGHDDVDNEVCGGKRTMWTQTTLSIPVGFDLEKLLRQFCRDPEAAQPKLSTSHSNTSLRRKLFTVSEDDSEELMVTAPSSVLSRSFMDNISDGEEISPMKTECKLRTEKINTPDTRLSAQFASSPIVSSGGCVTPLNKRCSLGNPNFMMESPNFSPIGKESSKIACQSNTIQTTFDTGYLTMQNNMSDFNGIVSIDSSKMKSLQYTQAPFLEKQNSLCGETEMEVSCDGFSVNNTML